MKSFFLKIFFTISLVVTIVTGSRLLLAHTTVDLSPLLSFSLRYFSIDFRCKKSTLHWPWGTRPILNFQNIEIKNKNLQVTAQNLLVIVDVWNPVQKIAEVQFQKTIIHLLNDSASPEKLSSPQDLQNLSNTVSGAMTIPLVQFSKSVEFYTKNIYFPYVKVEEISWRHVSGITKGLLKGPAGQARWDYQLQNTLWNWEIEHISVPEIVIALFKKQALPSTPLSIHGQLKGKWNEKECSLSGELKWDGIWLKNQGSEEGKGIFGPGFLSLSVKERAIAAKGQMTFDQAVLKADFNVRDFEKDPWSLKWHMDNKLSICQLKFWWPCLWGNDARIWMRDHFKGGDILSLSGMLTGLHTRLTALKGTFYIDHSVMQFLDGMPAIKELNAWTHFDFNGFYFQVLSGKMSGHTLKKGTVNISPLQGQAYLGVQIPLEGPFSDLISILNSPALEFTKGLPLSSIDGVATELINLKLPLRDDVTVKELEIFYKGSVAKGRFKLDCFGKKCLASGMNIDIQGNHHDIRVTGKGIFQGQPSSFQWQEVFAKANSKLLVVKGFFSEKEWEIKGIEKHFFTLLDPVPVTVQYYPNSHHWQGTAVLTNARFEIPITQFKKAKNESHSMTFLFHEKKKRLNFTSKGIIQGSGSCSFQSEMACDVNLTIPNRLSLHLKNTDQEKTLSLVADRLDFSSLSQQFKSSPGNIAKNSNLLSSAPQNQPVTISCKCASILMNFFEMKNLTLELSGLQKKTADFLAPFYTIKWSKMNGGATIIKKKTQLKNKPPRIGGISFKRLTPKGQESFLNIETNCIGLLCKEFGFQNHILKGKGKMQVYFKKDQSLLAQIRLYDVKTHTPPLGKLLSFLAPPFFTAFLPEGTGFSEINCDAFYKNNILSITKMLAKSLNLGLSLSGTIDLGKEKLALKGVAIPAYMLNALFRNIPILGHFIIGQNGFLSSDFTVTGSLSDPSLFVNPLSIFKLGFLKDVFKEDPTGPANEAFS